jgi:molybdopterin biosynthesis enzyme MoaB
VDWKVEKQTSDMNGGDSGRTLIINLPGSPKAVRESIGFIIGDLRHGLDILTGRDADCG